jgi:ribonucleoside-triphosphate reductase
VVDAKKYGIIKHVTDKEYYTNSSHVPVWYQCTPAHKAEIEGPYHALEPAGHIFYVEADADLTKNPEYVDVVNRMAWDNNVGYSSINHTQGRCKDCNYESNDPNLHRFGSTCPHCGGEWTTLDRVTGYLSSTYDKQSFGKKAEILDRVVHR